MMKGVADLLGPEVTLATTGVAGTDEVDGVLRAPSPWPPSSTAPLEQPL